MKNFLITIVGVVGSFITTFIGGWDTSIITLLIFLAIDFVMGLICAGIFHKSPKTETGALESKAGWKGLIRKCITILFVVVANRLDVQLGTTYIRDAVCIAFITNECISIVENAGLMGVPVPKVILNAIDILKNKDKTTSGENGSNS